MQEYDIHPYALIFPPMSKQDFDALAEDMRANGLLDPITLYSGQIIDGRNRYRACANLGITPKFTDFEGNDEEALALVVSKNLARRHLTLEEKAEIGRKIAGLGQGSGAWRKDGARSKVSTDTFGAKQVAEKLRISPESIKRMAALAKDRPDLHARVLAKELSISAAYNEMKGYTNEKDKGSDSQDVRDFEIQNDRSAEDSRSGPGNVSGDLGGPQPQQIVSKDASGSDGELSDAELETLDDYYRSRILSERRAKVEAKKDARYKKERELSTKQAALPAAKYGVVLADPEWKFETFSENGKDRSAENHYPTSATEDIMARGVETIAAEDCVLFLWATAPMIEDALRVMRAWGFTYKSQAIWNKDRIGTGYWLRNKHEILLIGTRGAIPAPAMGTQWPSVIDAPVGAHSAKPEKFYDLIEAYFPTLKKIELNARARREGWDAWGYEAPAAAE